MLCMGSLYSCRNLKIKRAGINFYQNVDYMQKMIYKNVEYGVQNTI